MSDENYYGQKSMDRILTGTEEMQALNVRAMAIANKRKDVTPDWSIISVLRTDKEQNELWRKGRDDTGREMYTGLIVTHADGYFDKSIHQSGDATDFVPYIDGKADWHDKAAFAIIASCYYEAAMELGIRIRWGGHFTKLYDGGHIEIVR
tara:strand:+ start:21776 stop:22225 length:450 start_codon:yes stop_codon:yes gene_type:complete